MAKSVCVRRRAGGAGASCALLLLLALAFLADIPAFAANSSIIESVSLAFTSEYGEEGEILPPEISCKTKDVEIDEITYQRDIDYWEPGQQERITVVLGASEGKYFSSKLSRENCKVTGTGASLVEAKTDSYGGLVMRVLYTPVSVLGSTTEAGWDSSHTRAVWNRVPYAPGYKLELYADNKKVKTYDKLTSNTLDLAEAMTDTSKFYYYEVKAIPITSDEKKYLKEGSFVTSTLEEVDTELTEDGKTYIASGQGNGVELNAWRYADRQWFYIDANGKKATGWLEKDGKRYFLGKDGAMCTGLTDTGNHTWCYFDQNGVMLTNLWVQDSPGNWYHMGEDGYMQTGWIEEGPGKWYWLDPATGVMHKGWLQFGDNWYYFRQEDGSMVTGWLLDGMRWFYFTEGGSMLRDVSVGSYTFGPDGALVVR